MKALSGMELRRAALAVLDWTYWTHPKNDDAWLFCPPDEPLSSSIRATIRRYEMKKLLNFGNVPLERLDGNTPAIESEPAVSEPMFLEWCEKNDLSFNLTKIGRIEYRIYTFTMGKPSEPGGYVFGATPSEARARAIVEAAREDKC